MSERLKLPNNYFPHDFNARLDRKILRLRKVLGLEGYAIYWMLIETLAVQPNFSYPLKDVDLLSHEFGTSFEKIEATIKQFDLFEIDDAANFFSLSLITRLQKYLEISEKARLAANKRWQKAQNRNKSNNNDKTLCERNADAMRTHSERNAIREQDIKEYKEDERVPTHSQVLLYGKEKNYSEQSCNKFYNYFNAQGWKTSKGIEIVDWKSKLNYWIANENNNNNDEIFIYSIKNDE